MYLRDSNKFSLCKSCTIIQRGIGELRELVQFRTLLTPGVSKKVMSESSKSEHNNKISRGNLRDRTNWQNCCNSI